MLMPVICEIYMLLMYLTMPLFTWYRGYADCLGKCYVAVENR